VALFVVIAALLILLVNQYIRKEALADAHTISQVILDRTLATHTYFSHQLKPSLFPITGMVKPASYFDPVWMSSTYAVREIQKYFQGLGNGDYYYKECAINACGPEKELRLLTQAFNTMSGRLHEHQRLLEERIRQRTAELTQANAELTTEAAQRLRTRPIGSALTARWP
jgi:hypothetical protein